MESNKNLNVPNLRFPEFEGEWEVKRIEEIATVSSGGTPSRTKSDYWNGNIPWITTSLIDFNRIRTAEEFITEDGLSNSSAKLFSKGTILMAMYGQGKTRGKVGILDVEASTNQACAALKIKNKFHVDFVFNYLAKDYEKIRNLANDGGQQNLSAGLIKSLKIKTPSLSEQIKLANFLVVIDERIQTQNKIIKNQESLMKGLIQQLISQKIRFKDKNGNSYPDWEKKELGYYLSVSKTKNIDLKFDKSDVLSVSGEFGVVNQIELQGRSFAGESVHNYGIVETGDVVYTKSPLKSNPYGIIKTNKGRTGIVSTLYAIYQCKETLNGIFLDYYFRLDDNTNRYLRPLVQKGSKNDMKINNEKVLIDPVVFPSFEEQTKIANFLTSIESKLENEKKILVQYQLQKKYLLQNLFI